MTLTAVPLKFAEAAETASWIRTMKKPSKPTEAQSLWLRQIAAHPMMVTRAQGEEDSFSLTNGRHVPAQTARVLIRRGWVMPQKDGLFDDSQTYHAKRALS